MAALNRGDASREAPRTLTPFPEDRCERLLPDSSIVRLKLSAVRLRRPRQSGACWLTLELWRELGLDRVWTELLDRSREGTRWNQVLFVLVAYRPLAPGSESRLHGEEVRADRCHDRLQRLVRRAALRLDPYLF